MGRIWSTHHTFELWLKVEIAVTEAWNQIGEVPDWAVAPIRQATFDVDDVARYEEETQHDVIAFLQSVNEGLGDAGRYVHFGLTSNDVKDTALSLQMIEAMDLIISGAERLRATIGSLALEHKDTLMMGRTHGIHAEPVTFGFKLAVWFDDLRRALERLQRVRGDIAVAKLAGAVGTHSNVPPEVEEIAARNLGLRPAPAETQIVQRDRHAEFVLELAVLGSVVDKMATEIRTLQRTEIREVQEPFGEKQAGSSAMPHKRNPNLSERITGLARLLRGYTTPALENIVLWNERDISNSSLERVVLPDASIVADYILALFNRVMSGLTVFPDRMRRNVEATHGLAFSQRVLRALIESGLPREEAYRIVQSDSLRAFDEDISLEDLLVSDPQVTQYLTTGRLHELFDYRHFTRNIDVTFERVGLVRSSGNEFPSEPPRPEQDGSVSAPRVDSREHINDAVP
jgi:adenylosuccinate lyase